MRNLKRISVLAVLLVTLAGARLLADNPHDQGQGHDHGHGKEEGKHADVYVYTEHDREEAHNWYRANESGLPPGLAKRDELPPGLEKQLRVRGTLPPGLAKKIQPCPPELVRRLPPPPPDCAHVVIGGHVVLLNRHTNIILDMIHFER